ncbi:hypothetical protein [Deinococcus aquatilis]|nr:hypothetical protein [Deinococcus aquatilis]
MAAKKVGQFHTFSEIKTKTIQPSILAVGGIKQISEFYRVRSRGCMA